MARHRLRFRANFSVPDMVATPKPSMLSGWTSTMLHSRLEGCQQQMWQKFNVKMYFRMFHGAEAAIGEGR